MSLTASVGWYAGDDGLLLAHAAPHRKRSGETRRYFMDFGACAEVLTNGDAIASQATAVTPTTTSPITLANGAVNGTRVEVDVAGGLADTEYRVAFTATLTSGAVLSRVGLLRVEDF